MCVKECPKKGEKPECMINSENTECTTPVFDTAMVFHYCLPEGDDAKEFFDSLYQKMDDKFNFGSYIADLQLCWRGMAIMMVVTMIIAIVYIFLLKWITKPLLYISMVVILVCFILLGGWCWIKRTEYDPVT